MPEYTSVSEITQLTENITVTAGKTIDGVDLSAHAHTVTDGSVKVDINNLDNVILTTPAVDQVLKYNGAEWVNAAGLISSAGRGTTFYFDTLASDVTSNETLSRTPNVITADDESQTLNNSTELIDSYSSISGGLGVTQINAGIWTFNSYTYLSTSDGTTKLRYIVHKIDNTTPWAETQLFSVDSDEITTIGIATTDAIVYTTTTIQPAFTITETQRLKIEVWGTTDNVGDVVIHFVHSGSYTSSVETPLPTKHNDLAGLEGGNGEFYHLTVTDYTGTGTGVMVRKNAPTLTGNTTVDRIGIGATPTTTYKFIVHNGSLKYEQVTSPITAPTLTLGAAGVLTGNYYYRVSYATAIGETDSGIVSSLIQPSSQKVELTNIPISLDTDVIARKIYRTVAGGSIYGLQLLTTINDNTTTVYSDNTTDIGLSADLDLQINTTGGLIYTDGHLIGAAGINSTTWGYDAFINKTGYNCSAFGVGCLENNTHGDNNVAYGYKVLNANTTGSNNTGAGVEVLLSNTTGNYNTAMGTNALKLNTTGSNNIAFGSDALAANISGTHNTAFGQQTLQNNNTGTYNNAFGTGALNHVTTGTFNIGVGTDAGRYITTGNYNIGIGYGATLGTLANGITGDYNIGIGLGNFAALIDGSNNIGIGTNALNANISGIGNIAIGGTLALYNCTNSQNVAIGNQAGSQITSGDHNTFLGNLAGNSDLQKADATNSMALGNGAYTTASNQIVMGNTNVTSVTINGSIQSPIIVTPTIASLINMNHTHAASGSTGGIIDHTVLSNIGTNTHAQIDTAITNLTGFINVVQTPFTLSNTGGAGSEQSAFPTGTLTITGNTTYIFEGHYIIQTGAGTGHTLALAFALGGGASITSIDYIASTNKSADANSVATAGQEARITQITTTVVNTSGAGPDVVRFKGILRMNVGGTITPQIRFGTTIASGTTTMALGSYIKFTPIGNGTLASIGSWA